MSEASKRVLAWRAKKREDGYQPVTIWIPARVKNQMVNDAFQLHRDLGELIAETYLAHPPTKGRRTAALMDRRHIEALVQEQVTRALASGTLPPPAPPVPKQALADTASRQKTVPQRACAVSRDQTGMPALCQGVSAGQTATRCGEAAG